MGADEAILVSDAALNALDTQGAARVLAAAINKIGGADIVTFGRQTLDDGLGLTAAETARVLGWPMLGLVGHIKVDGGNVQVAAHHRRGTAKRQGKIAGCDEHRPKHW